MCMEDSIVIVKNEIKMFVPKARRLSSRIKKKNCLKVVGNNGRGSSGKERLLQVDNFYKLPNNAR